MRIKLRQAFDLQMGKTPARNRPDYWNGDHKWISIADIGNAGKFLTKTKESITKAGIDGSGIKVVPQGTVIMSFKLSIGKTAIISEDMYTNEAIMAFIDNGKFAVDTDYLYHLCCGTNWTAGTNKAVMGLTLNKATLLEKEIPLPDINEQHEIATKLDKIDAIIAERQQQLELIDQAVKSRFIELFGDPVLNQHGWRKVALEVNATLLNGRAYKQDELLDSGKYPVLRVGNFFSNRGWYYSDLELDDDKYCDNGDLLYAWSASFGPQIWNGGKVIYHYHIWKVLVGEAYNKQFLCKLLEYATESLMGDTHGIAMMHLTKSGMEKTEFIVPPIERQEQFAAFVEQTDKSKYYSSLSFRYCQAAANTYRQEWMTCRTSDF